MKHKLGQLAKDSFIYGFGDLLGKAILFLLLPLYTRIFAPIEFGAIEALVLISTFLSIFLTMGMDGAQSFYFFKQKEQGKSSQVEVITAIMQWRLIWGSVIVVLAIFLSPLLNLLFFKGSLSWESFVLAFIGAFFVQFSSQCADLFRLLYQPVKFIFITLLYVIISSAVTILLVVYFKWGVNGYFAGICIGGGTAALFGCWLIRDYLDFSKLHREWWGRLIKFGLPVISSGLAMYALLSTDRWSIMHYRGQSALGIYAVGAKFVIFISVIVNAFRAAFLPIAMDAIHSDYGKRLFQTISRLYLGLGIICILLLTALSPLLIKLFSSPEYHAAYPIIGILSWYCLFYGFFLIVAAGVFKKEKTLFLVIPAVIAVLIDIALNIYLVPRFGGQGAAAATSISFFVVVFLIFLISEKIWPVNYPIGVMGLQLIVGLAGFGSLLYMHENNFRGYQIGFITISVCLILAITLLKYGQFIEAFKVVKLKMGGKK